MDLQLERTNALAHARTIVDAAKAAHRELTDFEQTTLTAAKARITQLDSQLKGRALVNSVMSLGTGDTIDDGLSNHGSIFTTEAKAGILNGVRTRTPYRTELVGGSKAALTGAMLPTSGITVEGGLHPTSQFPLASLLQNLPATGPSQRYYRTTAGVAEVVLESGVKPDMGIAFAAVDVLLQKLAGVAEFSDEMAEDGPWLLGFLQMEMLAAVAAAENALILSTFTGTSGVLATTGAAATVVDLVADAIGAQEAISGTTPSAIIAAPSVISTIRKAKASTSGVYVLDPIAPGPSQLHGVRLVSSPAASPTVVWVVVGSGVSVFRRGPVTFEVGHNGTNWVTNTQMARAEERIAVGVTRPSSLSKVTLT